MQQDPQGQGTQQPGNMPPNGGAPMGGQYPPTRPAGGGLGETMRRRVAVPVWGIAVTGLVLVCMLCGLMSAVVNGSGSSGGSQTNTSTQSGGAPKATHTPAPTATATHTPKWTTVQTFNGNGTKKTGTFTVPDDWKLVWSCDPSSESFTSQYNVIVSVYGSDGTPLDPVAVNTICKSGNTGDSTEEHQGGDVYLDINSEAAWKIQVQVLK